MMQSKRKSYNICRAAAWLFVLLFPLTVLAQMPWNTQAEYPKWETRAVWVTTLSGLDWPKTRATDDASRERQQKELCELLDKLKQCGINTVMFQARVRGSVIYPSDIEPWDVALTGKYDRHPGYDPLAFAIREAHARGMELHAWVVSVPAFKTAVARKMGKRSLLSKHPSLLKKHQDMYYLDPAQQQSADYLASICAEITRKYDVDGIHLDYIRYPEQTNRFPDALSYSKQGKGRSKADWRRDNITRMVRTVHEAVRPLKPWVKLSCSPVGKYRDTKRQSAMGWNCYDAVNQDVKLWMRKGWMDVVFPMMYFTGQHFYPFVTDWQEDAGNRPVVPGLGIYFLSPKEKDWPLTTVSAQVNVLRQQHMGGQAYFRSQFLTDNVKGLYTLLQNTFYAHPALPMPAPWLGNRIPATPAQLHYSVVSGQYQISWGAVPEIPGQGSIAYNVYASSKYPVDVTDARNLVAARIQDTCYAYNPRMWVNLAVTAIDRLGNESGALQLNFGHVDLATLRGDYFLTVRDGLVTLPQMRDVPYYAIKDVCGRRVKTGAWKENVDVSQLQGGWYRLYTLQRRGVSRLVGEFYK